MEIRKIPVTIEDSMDRGLSLIELCCAIAEGKGHNRRLDG
jgi:hypothetical protein